jgi:ferredoxin-type protein NapH
VIGPVFCSWICPVGTVVDGADKAIERFMPKLNARREERMKQSLEKKKKAKFVCPTCPFGRILANKNATVANGLLIGALAGSFILRFPVWCSICPIGILSQGMFHLKSVTRISQLSGFKDIWMPVLIELWIFPVIAVILCLREKRYWCRKICPVGALVRFFAKFNPFFKLRVKTAKQVAAEKSTTDEGNNSTYCSECSKMDQRTCERVCPQGLGPLKAKGSAECNKCLECYIECKQNMIGIKWFSTPDAVLWLKGFFKKLKKSFKK